MRTEINDIKRLFELEEKSRNNTIEEYSELPELFRLRSDYGPIDIFGMLIEALDKKDAQIAKCKEALKFTVKESGTGSNYNKLSRDTLAELETE